MVYLKDGICILLRVEFKTFCERIRLFIVFWMKKLIEINVKDKVCVFRM